MTCAADEFKCGQWEVCVPLRARCDGPADCPRAEDEAGCPCAPDAFRCADTALCLTAVSAAAPLPRCPAASRPVLPR